MLLYWSSSYFDFFCRPTTMPVSDRVISQEQLDSDLDADGDNGSNHIFLFTLLLVHHRPPPELHHSLLPFHFLEDRRDVERRRAVSVASCLSG